VHNSRRYSAKLTTGANTHHAEPEEQDAHEKVHPEPVAEELGVSRPPRDALVFFLGLSKDAGSVDVAG